MKIRLTDIDSVIPNLALMKLSHYHKSIDDEIYFYKSVERNLFEPDYDIIYGSSIFSWSTKKQQRLLANFPNAILAGTGSKNNRTVENIIGQPYENYDYSIYPDYKWSIGYTQRGCRFNCKFCVVPEKEGENKAIQTVNNIWRKGTEKKIRLIDNDFFGQEFWEDRCKEIIDGKFQVCLDQGINFRTLTDKQIDYLVQMDTRNHTFKSKCIYTAWDNLKHEKTFLDGLDQVQLKIKKGIIVYMLIGFIQETDEEIEYRIEQLVKRKVVVYPMIYNNRLNNDYNRLRLLRNWILTKACYSISFRQFLLQGGDTKKSKTSQQLSFDDYYHQMREILK